MDAGGWSIVISAIASGAVTVLGAVLTIVFKARQDRQRDILQALNEHIARLEKTNEHKDTVLDEMSWLQHKCEVRETQNRAWMERANDIMNEMIEELSSKSGKKFPRLELPPKEQNTDADRAAYVATRARYNTALAEGVKKQLSSNFTDQKASNNVQSPGS